MDTKSSEQNGREIRNSGRLELELGSVALTIYFLRKNPIKSFRVAGKNKIGRKTGNTHRSITPLPSKTVYYLFCCCQNY